MRERERVREKETVSGGSQASLSPEKITGVINYWWVTSECGTFCKMGEIVTGDVLMFQ